MGKQGKTSADVVVVAEDGALLDGSVSAEHDPHVVLADFLGQHPDKQFALCEKNQSEKRIQFRDKRTIYCRRTVAILAVGRFHLDRMVHLNNHSHVKDIYIYIYIKVNKKKGGKRVSCSEGGREGCAAIGYHKS